jgi:hypothetical protein
MPQPAARPAHCCVRTHTETVIRNCLRDERMRHVTMFVGLGFWLVAGDVQAQLPYTQSRGFIQYGIPGAIGAVGQPTFSPYLNLLRRGNSTLQNYCGLVRPEQQFRTANEQFQSNFNQVQRQLNTTQQSTFVPPLQSTGHRVRFRSHLTSGNGSLQSYRPAPPAVLPPGVHPPLVPQAGHRDYFGNQGAWFSSNPTVPRRCFNRQTSAVNGDTQLIRG